MKFNSISDLNIQLEFKEKLSKCNIPKYENQQQFYEYMIETRRCNTTVFSKITMIIL